MQKEKYITFFSKRKEIVLNTDTILYAVTENNAINIYTTGGETYKTRLTICELEDILGDAFIKIKRNSIVLAKAIESVTDSVNLKNGEMLKYPLRQKKRIIDELMQKVPCEIY